MAKVIILGSSNAVPNEQHENTHLVVTGADRTVLIDCVGNPIVRLPQAGISLEQITDLILTHFHPDHVSGVPLLLMDLWLLGRRLPLNIYGLPHAIERLQTMMDLYEWSNWPDFFPVHFNLVDEKEMTPVLEGEEFKIYASPVKHLIPNIGLRLEFKQSGKSLAYSSDTEPYQNVVRLAGGVDVLIHEAAGATPGHSSPAQAGETASQAEAGSLYLIHYRSKGLDRQQLIEEAQQTYQGPVELATDFMELDF